MSAAVSPPPDLLVQFRHFLGGVDVASPTWRSDAEAWLADRLGLSHKPRHPKFSIGEDDDSDDVESQDSAATQSSVETQTEGSVHVGVCITGDEVRPTEDRTTPEITKDWKDGVALRDGDVLRLLCVGVAKPRELEARLGLERAVAVRRAFVAPGKLQQLPFRGYDYKYVTDSCCESVVGIVPLPVGVAGPLRINGENLHVPMATTEGALVASTNRGCSAITKSGGVSSRVYEEGMTRAPVVKFDTASEAVSFRMWLSHPANFALVKEKFESSSRFAVLLRADVALDGRLAFVRFVAFTGDAMGMNMVSKGSSLAMQLLRELFPSMRVLSLSGNYCVDKKAAAINWISGRGRSVVADCTLPASVVATVLKTTPQDLVVAARAKLSAGSSLAASIGGNNAHAANVVAAVFLATGQDAAQVVSSSMCSTEMEVTDEGALYVSCTMPCLEVGTVGGGTILRPQNECLRMLGCAGAAHSQPGANARKLAEVICATVLAGELSLMAALTTDDLVASHMKLNRSRLNLYSSPAIMAAPKPESHRVKKNSERGTTIKVDCSNIL